MLRRPPLLALAVALPLTPARAQRPRVEPRMLIQIYGGASVAEPSLWSIPRQPLLVAGTSEYDTVALARHLTAGLVYGIGFEYFPLSHLGVLGRITYAGISTGSTCSGVYYHSTGMTPSDNEVLCGSIQSQTGPMALVQLDVEGVARILPRRAFSPYVRGGVSVASYEASTIYVEGLSQYGTRVVIDDPAQGSLAAGYSIGLGVTTWLGPGEQFHFDLGETWLGFPAVAGPADNFARAPARRRYPATVTFSFGLDFVLDGRRGRRY